MTILTRENIMQEAHKLARMYRVYMSYRKALQYSLKQLFKKLLAAGTQVVVRYTESTALRIALGADSAVNINKMVPIDVYNRLAQNAADSDPYRDGSVFKTGITIIKNGYVIEERPDHINYKWTPLAV